MLDRLELQGKLFELKGAVEANRTERALELTAELFRLTNTSPSGGRKA